MRHSYWWLALALAGCGPTETVDPWVPSSANRVGCPPSYDSVCNGGAAECPAGLVCLYERGGGQQVGTATCGPPVQCSTYNVR